MNASPFPTDKAGVFDAPSPETLPETALILAAAGKSSRFGAATKKPFVRIAGKPVWLHAAEPFVTRPEVRQLIIVLAPEDRDFFAAEFSDILDRLRRDVECILVDGGTERVDSVANALNVVPKNCELIAVHDAARPCVTGDCVEVVLRAAARIGAALPAVPVVATLKRSRDFEAAGVKDVKPQIEATVSRDRLWEAQTPQVFRSSLLREAYDRHIKNRMESIPTDDCELVERLGHPVEIVSGERTNIKITTTADLRMAEFFLREREWQ